jgi:hypothetical protein
MSGTMNSAENVAEYIQNSIGGWLNAGGQLQSNATQVAQWNQAFQAGQMSSAEYDSLLQDLTPIDDAGNDATYSGLVASFNDWVGNVLQLLSSI